MPPHSSDLRVLQPGGGGGDSTTGASAASNALRILGGHTEACSRFRSQTPVASLSPSTSIFYHITPCLSAMPEMG